MTEYTYKKMFRSSYAVFAKGKHIGYANKIGAEFDIPVEIRRKWVARPLSPERPHYPMEECKDKNGWIIFHNTRGEAAATLGKEVTA